MNSFTFRQTRSSSVVKRAVELLLPLAALLVVSLPLFSQGSQGTIQGGVFDSTGGALAGAKVTVLDVARGTTRTLTTDEAGKYAAPSLTTGTYTLRAEFSGFRTVERSNVLVEVGANVRVDLTLSPGEQNQTITVTEEVPAIDTTSATLGGTVSNQSIQSLPLNGRNFFRLLELRPGVVTVPGSSSGSSSSNGRRLGADVLLVEGITQFDLATSNTLINGSGKGSQGDTSNSLPIDAIQEFNSQQNAQAEYGWRDGSIVNVGIKSGTNSLHGTAYAFGRNASATDAKNYFTGTVTPAKVEQFGGTAGGRAVKDKIFWFAAFEGLRVDVPSTGSVTVPIDISVGDPKSSLVDACNAAKAAGTINPLSAQLVGLNTANCTVSPASSTFENLFPTNTTTSTTYFPSTPTQAPLNNGLAKGDWNLNDHNHVSGFFYISKSTQFSGGSLQPYWSTAGIGTTKEYAGAWTWTPNSTWVNDLRAGFAYAIGNQVPADVGRLPSDPYPTGYSVNTGVTNPEFGGLPQIAFSSFTSLGVTSKTGLRGPNGQFNIRDSVSYLRGNHSFKFGFEHVLVIFDDGSHANVAGTVNFDTLQNFLLGAPLSGSIIAGNPDERLRERWYSGFVQDTWRVTPRLTVTPGLRYEYIGSPHEKDNHLGTFDPTTAGGIVQVGPGLPQSRLYSPEKTDFSPRIGVAWDMFGNGKTVLRGGVSRLSSFPSITAVSEQTPFGANIVSCPSSASNAACIANGTFVVDQRGADLNKNFPQTLSFTGGAGGGQLGWNTTGPVFPITSAAGPSCTRFVPCGIGAVDPKLKQPKSIQWNLDIQRAITNRLTLDVAYVGNHGYAETHSIDLNAVPVGTGWTAPVVTACMNATTAAAINSACKPDGTTITNARPYNTQFPWFNYIVRTTSAGFHSNYSGLQVTVDQRAYHGLSFLAAYTYSHALDSWSKNSQNSQILADPSNPQAQYGNSDQDLRHRFRLSPTWLIPGKKSPGQMLEGWSVSGVLALQGGLPWGAVDSTKNDFVGTGEITNTYVASPNTGIVQFWNFSGPRSAFNASQVPIPCYNGINNKIAGCTALAAAPVDIQTACTTAAQSPYAGNATLQKLALQSLANNACYIRDGGILTPPAYGTNGNAGRNTFLGPNFRNVDMSISKNWHFGERYSAQFRTEFFNLFNQPNFAAPAIDPTKGVTGFFGYANTTPDSGNPVFGSGGPRHIQFGLKLAF
jgi:hypothetical protein